LLGNQPSQRYRLGIKTKKVYTGSEISINFSISNGNFS
jgi:hypothetical protein